MVVARTSWLIMTFYISKYLVLNFVHDEWRSSNVGGSAESMSSVLLCLPLRPSSKAPQVRLGECVFQVTFTKVNLSTFLC